MIGLKENLFLCIYKCRTLHPIQSVVLYYYSERGEKGEGENLLLPSNYTMAGKNLSLRTHPNFKSAVPNITNVNEIYNEIHAALTNQDTLKRKRVPWGSTTPDLNSFKINLEKVDRLYHLYHMGKDIYENSQYSMIVRLVAHEGLPPLYVELWGCCDFIKGFRSNEVGGFIFIAADVDVFMKVVTEDLSDSEKYPIYNLLQEDGIRVEREFDKNDVNFQEAKSCTINPKHIFQYSI